MILITESVLKATQNFFGHKRFSSSQSFILRDFKKMIKSDNYPTIDINLAMIY